MRLSGLERRASITTLASRIGGIHGLLACLTVLAARADDPPKPGAKGNPDNVPYIGKRDPDGNPVRLAKATGHVSNYSEDKVPKYTLPDPLVLANGERVTTPEVWTKKRRLSPSPIVTTWVVLSTVAEMPRLSTQPRPSRPRR